MRSDLQWAVTDGPEGTHAVVLPEDELGARRLSAHYRGRFWCSTAAGGCGGQLVLAAGLDSFRHRDANARCRFTVAGSAAGRAYDHLRYEPALAAWLAAEGYQPRLRRVPGPAGGVDLQVVVDEVDAVLEVRLSPLSDAGWRERDEADRRRYRHVAWFYGPGAEEAAATEAAVRGVSLELRRPNRGLVVGVRDADDRTRWVRLAACRLTADGFTAPGLEEARAAHRRRTSERREAARRAARHAAPPRTGRWEQLPFPA